MNFEQYKPKFDLSFERIKNELSVIQKSFTVLFDIQTIFSSDDRGKIKLSKPTFQTAHTNIKSSTNNINEELNCCLEIVQEYFNKTLKSNKINKEFDIVSNTVDNKKVISTLLGESKNNKNTSKELQNILFLKDRVLNLKYLASLFDTSLSDTQISKMSIEELINSVFIFEFIDTCSILYKNLAEFEQVIGNFYGDFKTNNYMEDIEVLLELHKRNLESYTYQDTRYKIVLEYDVNIGEMKVKPLNKYLLQQSVSLLVEQSCIDLIKKELKKGKFNKLIEVNIQKVKNNLRILIKNNGFDTKDFNSNEYINLILCDNLVNQMDVVLEVDTIENEGMSYILKL